VKYLLTSAGIKNASIQDALIDLLGKPIDDETAIQVVDGTVEVVSEGHWKLFAPEDARAARRGGAGNVALTRASGAVRWRVLCAAGRRMRSPHTCAILSARGCAH